MFYFPIWLAAILSLIYRPPVFNDHISWHRAWSLYTGFTVLLASVNAMWNWEKNSTDAWGEPAWIAWILATLR